MARHILRRTLPDPLPPLRGDLSPVLARVYAARRISGPAELDYALSRIYPYEGLAGIEQAVDLLAGSLARGERILVVGDFDADGATSTAVTVRLLRAMGAGHVDYLVPNRFEHGYGLTPALVEVAAGRRPHLIVTVDNGTAALEGVRAARERGIRVLVTDHHLPGPELPEADALVNPNQSGDAFPSKHLAGVGVAFYLMAALRAGLRRRGWFAERGLPEPNLASVLDLVALGTVADVVPLDYNNRVLTAQGLLRLRAGAGCPGVRALAAVAGRDPRRLTATDLGYVLAPRLNAAGRMSDMSIGIACLLAEGEADAQRLAGELDRLNRERRSVEAEMQEQALAAVEALALEDGGDLRLGLCVFDPGWHPGVVGLLASRLKERFHRPVVAFAAGPGGDLRGSARSVPSLHVRDALEAVSTRCPGLIARFGGHAMAAGLSLAPGRLPEFAEAFDREVRVRVGPEDLGGALLTDGPLDPAEVTLGLAEALRDGGPWGQGFPEPQFDGELQLIGSRVFGERHVRASVRLPGARHPVEAVAFGAAETPWPGPGESARMVYRLDAHDYQGRRSVRLLVEHVEPVAGRW